MLLDLNKTCEGNNCTFVLLSLPPFDSHYSSPIPQTERTAISSSTRYVLCAYLDLLDWVRLQLDHNASRACNHNALRHSTSWWHVRKNPLLKFNLVFGNGILGTKAQRSLSDNILVLYADTCALVCCKFASIGHAVTWSCPDMSLQSRGTLLPVWARPWHFLLKLNF